MDGQGSSVEESHKYPASRSSFSILILISNQLLLSTTSTTSRSSKDASLKPLQASKNKQPFLNMKFQTSSIFAAVLVVLSFSAVNALPFDGQAEPEAVLPVAAAAVEPLLTRGDGTFVVPEDAKVDETNNAGKKVNGCGYRSFFTYHSCL